MTFTPKLPAARTAPSTSAFGAWSPPIASSAMVSMSGRVTPQPLRQLLDPCTGRTSDRCGGEVWVHDNWGTPRDRMLSGHRVRGGCSSAYGSVYVWDSAYLYLNKSRPASALCQGFTIFRVPDYGARPSDRPPRVCNRTRSRSGSGRNRGRFLYRTRYTPAASATPTGPAPGGCPPTPSRPRKTQFPPRQRRS